MSLKEKIRLAIVSQLEIDLKVIVDSAIDAHETATHEETVAKSKYETFALEASYLAHGQSMRANEISESLSKFKVLNVETIEGPIKLASVVQLEKQDETRSWVFLGPLSGGIKVEVEGQSYTVVTPESPLGQQLVGAKEGEEIEVSQGGRKVDYYIYKVV